jgi:hypothetical protein
MCDNFGRPRLLHRAIAFPSFAAFCVVVVVVDRNDETKD